MFQVAVLYEVNAVKFCIKDVKDDDVEIDEVGCCWLLGRLYSNALQ